MTLTVFLLITAARRRPNRCAPQLHIIIFFVYLSRIHYSSMWICAPLAGSGSDLRALSVSDVRRLHIILIVDSNVAVARELTAPPAGELTAGELTALDVVATDVYAQRRLQRATGVVMHTLQRPVEGLGGEGELADLGWSPSRCRAEGGAARSARTPVAKLGQRAKLGEARGS